MDPFSISNWTLDAGSSLDLVDPLRIPDFCVQIRVQRVRLGLGGDFGPNRYTPGNHRLDTLEA